MLPNFSSFITRILNSVEAQAPISYKWFWTHVLMSPVSIQILVFISYCSPVQGRMAGTSISVAEFDSVIRGQHVYKSVWIPLTDKMHKHIMWEDNECDKYVVNNWLYQPPMGACTNQER